MRDPKKGRTMDKLSTALKAVGATALTVVVNLVSNLINGSTAWPQNGGEWATLIISSLGLGLSVFALPNTTDDPVVAREQSVRLKTGRHALPE